MTKIIVFYWEPGSCGDFVYSLLLSQPQQYQGVIKSFEITDRGQARPVIKPEFNESFISEYDQWYVKIWTVEECNRLRDMVSQLSAEYFIVPTHRPEQVKFLETQFPDIITMGIAYPVNMYPLVLKNWCKKVAGTHPAIQQHYNEPVHQYYKNKNVFGEFLLAEQLKRKSYIRQSVEPTFDISLSLEDLYNNQLTSILELLNNNSHVRQHFSNWITKQSTIHQYLYNMPATVRRALGYNSKSTLINQETVLLDQFDNILIKHSSADKAIPNFKTLSDACNYFGSDRP